MLCSVCEGRWRSGTPPLAQSILSPDVALCERCAVSAWDFAFAAEPVRLSTEPAPRTARLTHQLWTEDLPKTTAVVLQLGSTIWIEDRQRRRLQRPKQCSAPGCRFCGTLAETFRLGETTRVCATCIQAIRVLIRPENGLSPSENLYCVPAPDGSTSEVPFGDAIGFISQMGRPKA